MVGDIIGNFKVFESFIFVLLLVLFLECGGRELCYLIYFLESLRVIGRRMDRREFGLESFKGLFSYLD